MNRRLSVGWCWRLNRYTIPSCSCRKLCVTRRLSVCLSVCRLSVAWCSGQVRPSVVRRLTTPRAHRPHKTPAANTAGQSRWCGRNRCRTPHRDSTTHDTAPRLTGSTYYRTSQGGALKKGKRCMLVTIKMVVG